MEKNTVLAVVLSVIVITAGFMVQNMLYPPDPAPTEPVATRPEEERQPTQPLEETRTTPASSEDPPEPRTLSEMPVLGNPVLPVARDDISTQPVTYENDLMRVVFDPSGARIVSLQLLDHVDGDGPVEMIKQGDTDRGAMELHFGNDLAPPVDALFEQVHQDDSHTIVFRRDFYIEGTPDQPFEVRRVFRFFPGEHVIETAVEINNSVNRIIPLDFAGVAYTVSFGPQIGPSYAELDGRNECGSTGRRYRASISPW